MMDDGEIRLLVSRLARPHPSGGVVIERAAILAEGANSAAILSWVLAHDGQAEAVADPKAPRGLHAGRGSTSGRPPLRYVLPTETVR